MWRLIPTNGWRSSPREKQNWTKCCAAKDSALFSAAASECGAVSRLLTLLQENGHECWADNYVLMEAHRNIVAKKASILTSIRAADRHNAGCFRIAQSNARSSKTGGGLAAEGPVHSSCRNPIGLQCAPHR